MATLQLKTFLGQIPYLHPTTLPEANAQQCLDCWFVNGTLQPIKGSTEVSTLTNGLSTKLLYLYRPCPTDSSQKYWITSADKTDVAPSPVANDKYGRLFFARVDGSERPYFADVKSVLGRTNNTDLCTNTADTGPYPKTSYTLGVPAPGSTPDPNVRYAPTAIVSDNWSSLATSSDASTWVGAQGVSTTGQSFGTVFYNGSGRWLIGGQKGSILTSTDGITWSAATVDSAAVSLGVTVKCFAFSGSAYVAGCSGGKILHSTDGINWTLHTGSNSNPLGSTEDVNAVIWLSGKFYLGGNKGLARKTTTAAPSGAWESAGTLGDLFGSNNINAGTVTHNGVRGVFVGDKGIVVNYAPTLNNASDNDTWKRNTQVSTSEALIAVDGSTSGTGSFDLIAVISASQIWISQTFAGSNLTPGLVYESASVGSIPTLSALLAGATLTGVTCGASGQLILVGTKGKVAIQDYAGVIGSSYTAPSSSADFGENRLNGISFGGGRYVVVGNSAAGTADTRYYIVTLVDGFGSESAPSDPSNSVVVESGQAVALSWRAPDTTGLRLNLTGAKYRLYRTSTSGAGTDFQLVADRIPYAEGTVNYSDTTASSVLGEVIPSTDWTPPPSDLRGMVSTPGGVLAGYVGNTLWFSEPGQPHAWPTKYQRSVDFPIVGLSVFGNSILVATTGQPYLVQGIDPFNMAVTKLEASHACVSRDSIVDLGDRVVYASAVGLMSVSTSGVEWVTRQLFTPDQWKQLQPQTMRAVQWEGRYVAFFDGSGDYIPVGAKSLMIVPGAMEDGVAFFTADAAVAYRDPLDNTVYFVSKEEATSGKLCSWNTGSTFKTAKWLSKTFQSPNHVNFSWLQTQSDGHPLTVSHYVEDGANLLTKTTLSNYNSTTHSTDVTTIEYNAAGTEVGTYTGISLQNTTRLPPGRRSRNHAVRIETASTVMQVILSQSAEELRSV